VAFTTSESKTAAALQLGAHEVVRSRNDDEMGKHASSFDFILDTVGADQDIHPYLKLPKIDGSLTLVGQCRLNRWRILRSVRSAFNRLNDEDLNGSASQAALIIQLRIPSLTARGASH
jgi:D-arabinose 1-dehydrogenase-like Zn-dependent alcohol dehydrogenase